MNHWTEHDFNLWAYGLKTSEGHLEECGECRAEAARIAQIRKRATLAPEVSSDVLAAQRRAIYRRLGSEPARWWPLQWGVPLAGAALALALTVVSVRHSSSGAPLYNKTDEQFFSDLTSIEQSAEPRAIRPIRNLFEE
jgi:anti-sigma factor RsiW